MEVSEAYLAYQIRLFEYLIMAVILANSCVLASYDYGDRLMTTERNIYLHHIELAFQIVFLIECTLKIIGMGLFLKKNSYLRNGWNLLDFIVIILG